MAIDSSLINKIGSLKDFAGMIGERRNLGAAPGGGQGFAQTLETIQESMELAMANQFLETSLGIGMQEGGGQGGGLLGGVSLESLQTDLLRSLMEMQMDRLDPQRSATDTDPVAREAAINEAVAHVSKQIEEEESVVAEGAETAKAAGEATNAGHAPGKMSREFESGTQGPGAIGWDRTGGTSYGLYQLSSKAGTMDDFIDFLKRESPEWASRLQDAGEADTGSRWGRMPGVWREIAAEAPERFSELQHAFITDNHYRPALEAVMGSIGLDPDKLPGALKEVLFSTAVQHGAGGAAGIFEQAFSAVRSKGIDRDTLFSDLIDSVYDIRKGRFGSSSERVQNAVASRFDQEKELALRLLLDSQSALG